MGACSTRACITGGRAAAAPTGELRVAGPAGVHDTAYRDGRGGKPRCGGSVDERFHTTGVQDL